MRESEPTLVPVDDAGTFATVFRCARAWTSLASTTEEGVRFCDHCAQRVFWVRDAADLSVAVAEGRCIATQAPKDGGWLRHVGGLELPAYSTDGPLKWDE